MVCVNIHNCFYICTHRYHQKKNVSLSYSIKSATAKNRAERKMNIATKNHCIYAAQLLTSFLKALFHRIKQTLLEQVLYIKNISKSEALVAILFRIQSSIFILIKCSCNGKNTYWKILQNMHRVHTEPRVVRRPMEETLETGRTLSIPCSQSLYGG